MNYETYWSILDKPSNSISPQLILAIVLGISILVFTLLLKFKKPGFEKKFYLIIVSLFTIISLSMIIYSSFFLIDVSKERNIEFINSNERKVVEGRISNFKEGYKGKSKLESFDVDTVHFEYYDSAIYEFSHFGGNHSKALYNGRNVRITYANGMHENEIIKLEIEK